MRRLLFLLCALGAVSVALAQSKPAPWSNLGALHPGDKIRLVEADSKSVSGAFQSFSDNSLSIQNKAGAQTIHRKDIRSVKLLTNDRSLSGLPRRDRRSVPESFAGAVSIGPFEVSRWRDGRGDLPMGIQ